MEGINVVSTFDGMGCLYLAIKKQGIKVANYFSIEIDKHAIAVTKYNHPDIIELGDITKIKKEDFNGLKIDLLAGGSPCQGFSFAGKQLNFEDPRSKLFFEYVRLLEELKPTYFLLENVMMKKEYETIITRILGVKPIQINSALLCAQNRVRNYWTNINQKTFGLFGDAYTDIPQPKDKGILLKDVLEKDVPQKYYLSDKMISYFNTRKANFNNGKINYKDDNDKASCINASSGSIDISDNIIKEKPLFDVNHKLPCGVLNNNGVLKQTDKSTCLDANYHKSMDNHNQRTMICEQNTNHSQMDLILDQNANTIIDLSHKNEGLRFYEHKCPTFNQRDYKEPRLVIENDTQMGCIKFGRTDEAKQIRKESMANGKDYTPFQAKEIISIDFDKMNTITTMTTKDNLIIQINNSKESGGKQPYQPNRIYSQNGISPCLNTDKRTPLILEDLNERQKANLKSEDEKANTFLSTSYKGSQANGMTLVKQNRIRRLTPTECERLQTVPDGYTSLGIDTNGNTISISDTQRYRMLGNGWTIDVIAYILSFIKL